MAETKVFDKFSGIGVASGFKLQAKAPLDGRLVVDTIADRDALVTENGAYEGMPVYVKADKTTYILKGTTVSDWEADGSDTAADLSALSERVHVTESNVHNIQVALDSQIEFTQTEKDKLAGIAEGANKTTVDSALSSTSANPVQNKVVNTALGGKVPTTRKINGKALSADITLSADNVGAIAATAKGTAGGVAELDENGKVPSEQLPSYVDDVVEGYLSGGKFYKEAAHTTEIAGESSKIYVDLATNKTYRWSGTAFAEISASLALGETSSTAYRGDRGKAAYDHSQAAHAPSNAERNVVVGIKKNGADVTVGTDRKVDINVPTKVSELTNDSKYLTKGDTIDYAGYANTAGRLDCTFTIDGIETDGSDNISHYGTCSTPAATAAKEVNDLTPFDLTVGARAIIKFTVTNTAANPTLSIDNSPAKAIKYRGAAISAGALAANRTYEFVYNGTDYELVGDLDSDTTYAKATTAKDGLMSKEDKAKLDGVEEGANKTVVDSELNETSENPVQNKVIQAALDDKAAVSHGTHVTYGTTAPKANGTASAGTAASVSRSDHVHPAQTTVSGNAGTATKLATARTIGLSGAVEGTAKSFDGSANVSIPVTSVNAIYLALTEGDTLVLDGTI